MEQAQATKLIRQLFTEATFELFESMDCNVVQTNERDINTDYIPAAYIDAGANDLELLLTLRLPLPALTMTYPAGDQAISVDESLLEDWILELSNRLMGQLKSKLLARNCRLNTGLPDHDLTAVDSQKLSQLRYYPLFLDIDNEPVEVGITLELLRDKIDLDEYEKVDVNAVQAGDIDFFF
jgi:hypothetical protein